MARKTASSTPARTTKRGTPSRAKAKSKSRPTGIVKSAWQLLSLTFMGRIVLASLGLALLIVINLYAFSFRYEAFFTALGIELTVIGVLLWIRFLLRTRSPQP